MTDNITSDNVLDFTMPFSDEMYNHYDDPDRSFQQFPILDVTKDIANIQRIELSTHMGTHIDAPYHMLSDGKFLHEFSFERFIGDGVILEADVGEGEAITPGDIDIDMIQGGDIVFLSTGWETRFTDASYTSHPHVSTELADVLVEHDVKILGTDTPTPDLARDFRPEDWEEFSRERLFSEILPVHERLLSAETLIIENLGGLIPARGRRLSIVIAPLKLRNADGAPVRVIGFQ